jgi:hypothetical protein
MILNKEQPTSDQQLLSHALAEVARQSALMRAEYVEYIRKGTSMKTGRRWYEPMAAAWPDYQATRAHLAAVIATIKPAINSCANCRYELSCGYSHLQSLGHRTEFSVGPCPLGQRSNGKPFFEAGAAAQMEQT